MPVVRSDQELQGGRAHPETRGASAVTAAAQDSGSVHTSHPVTATQASCSDIVIATTVIVS
uniref:Uncharacterized protein n=1 Tax=Arundo donax TaxID=35708 RepID=A0A0A9E5M1_ARUDO